MSSWFKKCAAVLLFNVVLFAAPMAGAQEAPLPDRLSADWFTYVSAEDAPVQERLTSLKAATQEFAVELKEANPTVSEDVAPLIDELVALIDLYGVLKTQSETPDVTPVLIPDAVPLSELVPLIARYRETDLDASLAAEEISRAKDLETDTVQDLDTRKAAYLALPENDAGRIAQGLQIMRDRFVVAVTAEERRIAAPAAAALEDAAEKLRQTIDLVPEIVTVDEGAAADFAQEENKLARAEEKQRGRLLAARLARTESTKSDAAGGGSGAALELQLRVQSAEMALAETVLQRQRMALLGSLASHLVDESGASNGDKLEALLRAQQSVAAQNAGQLVGWQATADRARSASTAQLSGAAESGRQDSRALEKRFEEAMASTESVARLRELVARTELLHLVVDRRLQSERGALATFLGRTRELMSNAWSLGFDLSSRSLFTINETPITLGSILRVLLILAIAYWVSKAVQHSFERVSASRDIMSRPALYTISRLIHYGILTVGFLVALTAIGIDFTRFAILLSALGVGLGFGLQAIFSNFVSGLIILIEKSLKVGDFVDLESGVTGEVKEINIRSTLITTNDNVDILVPNSEFVSGRVINWTLRDTARRIHVPFGVAYGTDKELVKKAALEAADNVDYTLHSVEARKPQVWLTGFGDSSLDFELIVWLTDDAVKRPDTVNAAYNWAIETALGKYDIEIPFPQRDLHFKSGAEALATPGQQI